MAKKQKVNSGAKDLRKPHFKSFYYVLFALFLLLFFASLMLSGGAKLTAALFYDRVDTFMDHYNSVVYNEVSDPYEILVVYPPLASLMYKLCNIAIPSDDYRSFVSDPSELSQNRAMKVNQSFVFQFVLYWIIALLIFLAALCLLKKGSSADKALFVGATVLSSPFLYMADRGNNVILPVAFSIFFIVLYDNENKILREIGLISLAVAVGLKLYPVAFLLIFIADKRYKELGRELIYIFVTLVLPFFIFYKGFSSMILMFRNLLGFDAKRTIESNLAGQLDFKRMFFFLYGVTHHYTGLTIPDGVREILASICRYGMSAVCAFGTLFSRKMWVRTMLIAAVIYGFPGSASTYILLFMVIPVALMLDEEKTPSFKNYLYLFLIIMTQVPVIMLSEDGYSRYLPTKVSSIAVAFIVFMALIDMIIDFAAWNKARRMIKKPFFKSAVEALADRFFRKTVPAAVEDSGDVIDPSVDLSGDPIDPDQCVSSGDSVAPDQCASCGVPGEVLSACSFSQNQGEGGTEQ